MAFCQVSIVHLLFTCLASHLLGFAAVVQGHPPHILFILADDFGWGNFGPHRHGDCQGNEACEQAQKEVHTPKLDLLVEQGILLQRHYAYRICSPSRCSLQTGRLAVHVNAKNTGVTSYNESDPISGYAGIPRNMTGIAEKLKTLGYQTHLVGKWDAGMATPQHTPWGRGYDTWLGYFQHANDYWTKGGNIAATGEIDNCLNSFLDFFETSAAYRGGVQRPNLLSDDCENSTAPDPPCYEEYIFKMRAKEIIRRHDASVPLFLFYSFHLIHSPLQVPLSYQERIKDMVRLRGGEPFSSRNRMLYAAMVLYLDDVVGELTQELKTKQMWSNTLIVFTSDNGGPIYEPGSGNNHPLKGGKYSDWEGGVRTNAFLSGGYIPERLRNTQNEHIISIADWYATLCVISGGSVSFCTSDTKAEEANKWIQQTKNGLPLLPAIDSVPQWTSILSHTPARSGVFHLSENSVIEWPFKLVIGIQNYSSWTGELYPNCSTIWNLTQGWGPQFVDFKVFGVPQADSDPAENERVFWQEDCTSGCLYNIREDSAEQMNLASKNPVKTSFLKRRLNELNENNFLPYRGDGSFKACTRSLANGHYYGPFVHAEHFYTEPFVPINSTENRELLKQLLVVNGPGGLVQEAIVFLFGKASPIVGMASRYLTDVCLTCETFAESESYEGSSSMRDMIFAFLLGCTGMMCVTAVLAYVCSRRNKHNADKRQPSLPRDTSASIDSVGSADSGVEDA